ncbi:MAG: hypothetical protein ACI8XI_000282 [Woeseiaceae bacterium]|mgnify:FL=1|jgi:hypothetical protein|tara:strand:- start:38182 stop:38490 length:309 start_codon:yes stop_codon:yes gene_type:complete
MRYSRRISKNMLLISIVFIFISSSFSQENNSVVEPLDSVVEKNETQDTTSVKEVVLKSTESTANESQTVYDIDDQTYEEADDDFIPSEEIPADEPIPFPTNI